MLKGLRKLLNNTRLPGGSFSQVCLVVALLLIVAYLVTLRVSPEHAYIIFLVAAAVVVLLIVPLIILAGRYPLETTLSGPELLKYARLEGRKGRPFMLPAPPESDHPMLLQQGENEEQPDSPPPASLNGPKTEGK